MFAETYFAAGANASALRNLPIRPIADNAILRDDACPSVGGQLFVLAKAERNEDAGLVEAAHRPFLRAHLRPVFVERVRMRARVQYTVGVAHSVLGERDALLPLVDLKLISLRNVVGTRLVVRLTRTQFGQLNQSKHTES